MTILAKFQCDWADEHDVYGFTVYKSREELEKVFTYVTAWFEENPGETIELGFGTNQYLGFEDVESFRRSLTIMDVTDEELQTLKKFFGCRWNEDRVDFGFTGWCDITDYIIPYGDDDKNERLDILANELWPVEPGW